MVFWKRAGVAGLGKGHLAFGRTASPPGIKKDVAYTPDNQRLRVSMLVLPLLPPPCALVKTCKREEPTMTPVSPRLRPKTGSGAA
jgi:hypothetical protein